MNNRSCQSERDIVYCDRCDKNLIKKKKQMLRREKKRRTKGQKYSLIRASVARRAF